MHTIELDGVAYQLPQQWSEIKSGHAKPDQLSQLLQALLGIDPKVWKKIHHKYFGLGLAPEVQKKNATVLHDLLGLCKWVWEKPMNQQPKIAESNLKLFFDHILKHLFI